MSLLLFATYEKFIGTWICVNCFAGTVSPYISPVPTLTLVVRS